MTREEAIEIIKCGDIYNRWGKDGEEVEKMAIKALEQQTCEDAVSRKDVLNLVDNLNDGSFRWASIRTKIARLHLVQPETTACTDAVSRQAVLDIFANNADAVRPYSKTWEEVKALPSVNPQPKIGWIPVSERLPEDYELVLFSTKTDRVFEGRYFDDNTDRQWYAFRDETFAWNNVVTAWMPLPKPYEPQESEVSE